MATAVALISSMANRLVAKHRGLEVGAAAEAIYDVWTNLCTFTEAWRETVSINTVEHQTTYALATSYDSGATISAIRKVRYPDTLVELPDTLWRFDPNTNSIVFRYESSITKTAYIEAVCVMMPIANSPAGINPFLFNVWQNAIWAGVNASICSQQNRPWTSDADYRNFMDTYNLLRGGIRVDSERDGTRRVLRMHCPSVF